MEAEIITIGTELLLGEIVDTNTAVIARSLKEVGIDLYRTVTVGDNIDRISQVLREAASRAQVIITTGGLGPTVDDPTREAIALAAELPLEFQDTLWEQIQNRFARFGRTPTENNRRQAYIPAGSRPLINPVGTAPAFIVQIGKAVVFALPGVPSEMEYLLRHEVLPFLKDHFQPQGVIHTRILRTSGVGESWIDSKLEDLEYMTNPSVGLAAHSGRVDVRITAKAESPEAAEDLIQPVENTIRSRLGQAIYGVDHLPLEGVVLDRIQQNDWNLVVAEAGTYGALTSALAQRGDSFVKGMVLAMGQSETQVTSALEQLRGERNAEVGLGLALHAEIDRTRADIEVITPIGRKSLTRYYAGHPDQAIAWSVSVAVDALRRQLFEIPDAFKDEVRLGNHNSHR